jgi:hypothetical protein
MSRMLGSWQTERDETGEEQSQEHAHNFFFDIKEIVHKEFVMADQTVYSAYYCDVLRRLRENIQRLRPELWRQKNLLLHHDNSPSRTSLFTREFFTKNKMTIVPRHPTFLCFPDRR